VRAKMAAGDFDGARKAVMRCRGEEAEKLYAECSAAIDRGERAGLKKQLAAQGFHGWKLEVSAKGARRKAEIEKLVAEELAKAGVDLDLPELDEAAAKAAIARAQRRVASAGREPVAIKLVPLIDASLRSRLPSSS
ncbi:MAG TPA: hypothetical protein VHB21_09135, partial [Minicystis sp.]|nr:hypothetical protein [Minicystis sp.]